MNEQITESTIAKVADRQKAGAYQPTSIDTMKTKVDFRIMQVDPYVILWRNGVTEYVNWRTLNKLKKSHTWCTDF